MQNRIKSRKYFPYTSIKISENFNKSKVYLSKEKNDSKERYSTNFSSSHLELYSKKGGLKKFATCLLIYH